MVELSRKYEAEGIRVGTMRAYEHKLREHMSMSSVMESGAVDERHGRIAMRLEADVQVAAEKVERAKRETEAAERAAKAAARAFDEGLQASLVAKDAALQVMLDQWRAVARLLSETAAQAASVHVVTVDSIRGQLEPLGDVGGDRRARSAAEESSLQERSAQLLSTVESVFDNAGRMSQSTQGQIVPARGAGTDGGAPGPSRGKWGDSAWRPEATPGYKAMAERARERERAEREASRARQRQLEDASAADRYIDE